MTHPIICLVNKTTDTTADVALQNIAQAVNHQIQRNVCPAWGSTMWYVIASNTPPANTYPLYLFDTPDVANALGYHDETPEGQIYGRVFKQPVFDNGGTWYTGSLSISAVVSHEAIEIFGDADVNEWVADEQGRMIARELCDPCESDAYAMNVITPTGLLSVALSDFVYPEWFDWAAPAGSRFDQMHKITAPFQLSVGGYLIYETDPNDAQQQFNEKETRPAWKQALKDAPGSRTSRRKAQMP